MKKRVAHTIALQWYRVTAIGRPVTYVCTTQARATSSEYHYALMDPVKLPPRDWLEREVGVAKDTLIRTGQHLTLLEDTLSGLPLDKSIAA